MARKMLLNHIGMDGNQKIDSLVEKMTDIPEVLRMQVCIRAINNIGDMIEGLTRLGLPGMDALIIAIQESDFVLANSVKHHAYTSGTLEHTIGVYSKMMDSNLQNGSCFSNEEIAIVGYLHDICMANHPDWNEFADLHGVKSGDIIRKYLPTVAKDYPESMFAIEHHGSKFHDDKMVMEHPLLDLLLQCDRKDADECPVGQIIL